MEKSDCTKMIFNEDELPLSVLKKMITPALSPNDHSRKKIAKRKSRWSMGITQKKATKKGKGELAAEITEYVFKKENVKNELLGDIEKANLTIEQVNVLQFLLQTFKNRIKKTFKNDSSSHYERESKKKEGEKPVDKSNLSVTESEVESNLSQTKDITNFSKIIEMKHVLESEQKTMEELKSDKKSPNKLEGIEEKTSVTSKINKETKLLKKAHRSDKEMLISDISIGAKHNCIMAEWVEEDLKKVKLSKPIFKVIGEKSDFVKMPIKNDHSPKKIATRKSRRISDMIQKKAKKEDCSSKIDEIEKEEDNGKFELNDYVEHDKKYFFGHSAEMGCKLCDFKGILIVQHYKIKHPESEVLISRINPDIAKVLIEDAIRNRRKYDMDHLELEKLPCNFKCPFCLMLIKDTHNTYYNHIASHTGEYCLQSNHCPYLSYDHMDQIHFKIHKSEELKYVFGHICSKCNFIQLIRETVEKHAMVHHLGIPEIHRVNLGLVLHEDTVDENCTNGIHSNENHSNVNNSIDVIMSGAGKIYNHNLTIQAELKELSVFDSSLQIKELKGVKIKTEPKVLEGDLYPTGFDMFTCHTDMEIKQESESDKTEMLQWINENAKEAGASISDGLQNKLVTEPVEENEKVQINTQLSIPLVTEVKEEPLSSKVKFPIIASVQSPALKMRQFVPTSGDNSKCVLALTEIAIINIEKQNREYPKGVAVMMKPSLLNTLYKCNVSKLVPPYNCVDDGFPNCSFKTLYFDEYVKHLEAIHQTYELGSFSSELELQRGAIMEGWLAREVGPFQCSYCKKATVTHQEMQRHQTMFHARMQCWFYYRKFVPNDTVTNPEQVNPEDPSFINHVIHLPHQIHLCDFKIDLDQSELLLDEPEIFSVPVDNERDLPGEADPLYIDEEFPKDGGARDNEMLAIELMGETMRKSTRKKCRWEGCYETYRFQKPLVYHIEKDHVALQRGEKFTCFWISCSRKGKPFNHRYELLIHMRVHGGEEPYKCPFKGCKKAFPILQNLNKHHLKHMGKRLYSCEFSTCCKTFSRLFQRMTHQRMHDKLGAWQDTDYSENYTAPNILWGHAKKHTFDNQLEVKHKSSNSSNEIKHQTTHHNVTIAEQVNLGDPSINHSSKLINGASKAPQPPSRDFEVNPDQLEVPLDKSEIFRVPANNEGSLLSMSTSLCLSNEFSKESSAGNDDMSAIQLMDEAPQKSTEKKLQCRWEGCYEIYHFQTLLIEHIEKDHVNLQRGENFPCLWINCSKKTVPFNHRYELLTHMRIHSGEKPHRCPFQGCSKAFTCLQNLNKHQKEHTGEKLYSCEFSTCYKTFSRLLHKMTHLRMHDKEHVKNHTFDDQLEVTQTSVESKKNEGIKYERPHHNVCKWERCYQIYDSRMALVKHIKKHGQLQSGKEFICLWKNCSRNLKCFNNRAKLLLHMQIHTREKRHKCPFQGCNKAFLRSDTLTYHQRSHTGERPYMCQFSNCLKSYSSSGQRNIHEKTHYIKPHACRVTSCSKKYAELCDLQDHMKIHGIEEQVDEKSFNSSNNAKLQETCDDTERSHTGGGPYLCQFSNCFKSFLTSDDRNAHQSMHYTHYIKYTNQTASWNHKKSHLVDRQVKWKSVEDKEKEDDFALKKSSNSSQEAKHQRIHYDDCKWEGCYQIYYSQSGLVKHVEESHVKRQTGEEFTCSWIDCPRKSKPYSTKPYLAIHMRLHTQEKPYKCSFPGCKKAFSRLYTIKVHQRSHTGERPYMCQFVNCFKSFKNCNNRSEHQRIHYKTKLCACQVTGCSKRYFTIGNLQAHMKKHTADEQLEVKSESMENNQKEDSC